MTFFRYRRPSLNTLLGITRVKKRVKKELGITDALNAMSQRRKSIVLKENRPSSRAS
jgi:hypothetical protein